MVAHFIAVGFPIAMAIVAFLDYSFFSWHPVFMAVAYMCLMAEGILAFSTHSSLVGKGKRLNLHGYFLFAALMSALAGFWVIFSTKNSFGRPHFTTPHGITGVITVGYTAVQVSAGLFLRYARLFNLPPTVKIADIKLGHAGSGLFLFTLASLTTLGGLQTDWFVGRVHQYVWGFSCISVVLMDLLIGVQVVQMFRRKLGGAKKKEVK